MERNKKNRSIDYRKLIGFLKTAGWVLLLPVMLLIVYITIDNSSENPRLALPQTREAMVESGLHTIQIALERFAVANDDHYPPTIEYLLQEGYLLSMPDNQFTHRPMQSIPFGWEPFEGDFTHLSVVEGEDIIGYYLIGYGSEDNPGLDIDGDSIPDHVIVVLETDIDLPLDLPPLGELLNR